MSKIKSFAKDRVYSQGNQSFRDPNLRYASWGNQFSVICEIKKQDSLGHEKVIASKEKLPFCVCIFKQGSS